MGWSQNRRFGGESMRKGKKVVEIRRETVEASDGALLHVESRGEGAPVVFLPCWMGTTRFWDRQAGPLSDRFRVVAVDPRAHGNSSKALHGHTIPRYAEDVRAVLLALDLRDTALVGWSFTGSVVLEYWKRYGDDRLRAIGLVDVSPFPFSPDDWNGHGLRGFNFDGMNATVRALEDDRGGFMDRFFPGAGVREEDRAWMAGEMAKTPAAAAAAIYSDFLMRDLYSALPTVSVPAIVWAAESPSRRDGIAMGSRLASRIPGARFAPFERGGHFLNWNEADAFNASVVAFLSGG
jgi:non-heme chloroperoxidase